MEKETHQKYTEDELNERLRSGKISTIDKELQRKILKGETLTEEEKKQFGMDFEEWKFYHDTEREHMVEGFRWGVWPILFICGFFLLSSAISNTKYLRVDPSAGTSVWVTTIVSWVLAAASIIGAFWMKNHGHRLKMRQLEKEQELLQAYVHEDMDENEEKGSNLSENMSDACEKTSEMHGKMSGKRSVSLFEKAALAENQDDKSSKTGE